MVGGGNQVAQSLDVQCRAGAQLHMTHAFARAFEQAGGVRERGTIVEADIRVNLERIDISKRRVSQTSDRTSVVRSSRTPAPQPRMRSNHIRAINRKGSAKSENQASIRGSRRTALGNRNRSFI